MAKAKVKYDYKQYPASVESRSGCKVSWYYYKDEATAKQASEAARHNMLIQERQGYDFGYQSPGAVRGPDNGWFPGLWEVCIP